MPEISLPATLIAGRDRALPETSDRVVTLLGLAARLRPTAMLLAITRLVEFRKDIPESFASSSQCRYTWRVRDVPVIPADIPLSAVRRPFGTGRGPGSHLCPASGCRRHIGADRFMCRSHWYQVPKPLRDALWATWRSGVGVGTPEHTHAILAVIVAASGLSPSDISSHDQNQEGDMT